MRFGLAIFAFDRRWLNTSRIDAIQAAFEITPPLKAGGSDPLEAYKPGLLSRAYGRGHHQLFAEGLPFRTSGRITETFVGNSGFGELIVRLHAEDKSAIEPLRAFAYWLGALPECAFGTWCEIDVEGTDSHAFSSRGHRSPRYLNKIGLPHLGTATFFGKQLVARMSEEVFTELQARPLPGGNRVVELATTNLSSESLVALQDSRTVPLVKAGLVGSYQGHPAFGKAGPEWRPLDLVNSQPPTSQPSLDFGETKAPPSLPPGRAVEPAISKLKKQWRTVETDSDQEDQQQVAMAVLDELADLQAEHPDRLDLLKYRVQLLAYPLEQWEDVRREMAPLREVPEYAEMIARFDQERSVQPFS